LDTSILSSTRQTTLVLPILLETYRDLDAGDVLGDMIGLIRDLEISLAEIRKESRGGKRAGAYLAAIAPPMRLATLLGATDLADASSRLQEAFSGEEAETPVHGAAGAHVLVWVTIAEQTLVALRLLFQAAHLYGRAPNGKRIGDPQPAPGAAAKA